MTEGSGVFAEETGRCANCGFKVDFSIAPSTTTLNKTMFERVAIVEDMDAIRLLVRDTLIQHRMCDLVDDFTHGGVFIQSLQAMVHLGRIYDLVILDLQMPMVNGLQAASFLRNLEKKNAWVPSPILFFSSVVCDPRLQQQFQTLGPAVYLNKATIGNKENLPERLYQVLIALLPFT